MPTHNPQEFATSLSAKLATRSRHVCLFLGAGVARACGLPDVSDLQECVCSDLTDRDREVFEHQLEGRNIEQVLSRLRRISGLITGSETVDGITASEAKALDASVCNAIVRALNINKADLTPVLNLAAWAARADYRQPVEFFTINYDLLLETAFENHGVPYFDGFVGNLKAKFRTEIVEAQPGVGSGFMPAQFVRLWKLHGSVNWVRSDEQQIVRLGTPVPEDLPAAIYPSDAKYEESRRVPFVVLQDRFRRSIQQPETLVLIAGYSFGDAHLNEMLFDAAMRRERSEFVVFSYEAIPEILLKRACSTPNMQVICKNEAILGGIQGAWKKLSDEIEIPNLWIKEEMVLPDFSHLACYLARSSSWEKEIFNKPIAVDDNITNMDGGNDA